MSEIEQITLKLAHPFGLSRGSRTEVQNVFLRIHDGIGEGAPIYYHGQNAQTLYEIGTSLLPKLSPSHKPIRQLIEELFSTLPHQSALIQAIDLALHDHVSKTMKIPLYQLFDLPKPDGIRSCFTIGLDTREIMLRKLRQAEAYPILKIKVGTDSDMEMLEMIRLETGKPIYVDANEGWSLKQAIAYLPRLSELGVQLVEQPFPREDTASYAALKQMQLTDLPVIIDEGVQSPEDVPRWAGLADGINVKLAKCGGIYRARRVINQAKNLGLKVMLGCMIESSLAVTAAAHLASQADYVDLDGAALLSNDPFDGMQLINGIIHMPDRNGIGAIRKESVNR